MSDTTDHAAAIRELLTGVDWDRMSGARKMHAAIEHADALAAALALERARAERLRAFVQFVEKNLPIIHWRKAHAELLHPGDLDPTETTP